ncbi:porin [Leptothrix sp. BB-4]
MKKSLIALAVLSAFAGVASAQSSVTLSGSLDAGLNRTAGVTGLKGAGSSRNALTFSGVEDLGNGNSAFFTLNHRFNIQSGTQNGANTTTVGNASDDVNGQQFYRNAFLGLKNNDIGDVRLGRILMPDQEINGGFEAWSGGDGAAAVHADGRGANPAQANLRSNQAIYVRSASLGGLVIHAAQARRLGDTNQTNTVAPRGFGAVYTFGPAAVGAATDRNDNDKKTTGLYAKYDLGAALLFTQYERSDTNAAGTKDKRLTFSARIPVGDVTYKVGYRIMNRDDAAATGSAKKVGVGLEYNLSKRTQFYTSIGKTSGSDIEVTNKLTATAAEGTAARKPTADIGIWHKF